MRAREQKKSLSVQAVAGTEVVFLGLNVSPQAAKNLIGFTIKRTLLGNRDAAIHVRGHPAWQREMDRLKQRYDRPDRPFEFLIAPGIGTFEQYVSLGMPCGASADGRLAGQPVASDFSPAPVPADQPAHRTDADGNVIGHAREVSIHRALDTFEDATYDFLCDGAPADLTIREEFSPRALEEVLRRFADGRVGNMLTITVANPETFAAAREHPRRFNLLRVRMGGWHENFITLFPGHQDQHVRRPLHVEGDR